LANYSRQGFLSIMPMAGNYAFAVYPYQFPTAPGVGAEVLDLSGFLKRLTGQHQGLVWGGGTSALKMAMSLGSLQ